MILLKLIALISTFCILKCSQEVSTEIPNFLCGQVEKLKAEHPEIFSVVFAKWKTGFDLSIIDNTVKCLSDEVSVLSMDLNEKSKGIKVKRKFFSFIQGKIDQNIYEYFRVTDVSIHNPPVLILFTDYFVNVSILYEKFKIVGKVNMRVNKHDILQCFFL